MCVLPSHCLLASYCHAGLATSFQKWPEGFGGKRQLRKGRTSREELSTISDVSKVKLYTAAAAAKSLQSCVTLCDPIDVSLPDSEVPGILQARTLEWVAISFSSA